MNSESKPFGIRETLLGFVPAIALLRDFDFEERRLDPFCSIGSESKPLGLRKKLLGFVPAIALLCVILRAVVLISKKGGRIRSAQLTESSSITPSRDNE